MDPKASLRWATLEVTVTKLLGILSAVLVARVLGAETMGLIALVYLVMAASQLLSNFGLSQAIVQAKHVTKGQLATLYSLNWFLGVTAFLITMAVSPWVAAFFEEPLLATIMPVAGIGFLISPIAQQVTALLQKNMQFREIAIATMVGAVIGLIAAVTGVQAGFGIWSPIFAGLLSNFVSQLILLYIGLRQRLLSGFCLNIAQTRPLLGFGAYYSGAMALNLFNSRIDQFIIGATLGAAPLGLYSMSANWTTNIMQQVNRIATRVAFPAIARFQDDIPRVKKAFLRLVNRATTVNSALFFGLAATAETLVGALLGVDWLEMVPVLQLMCGYALMRSLGNLRGTLVLGLGKSKWVFYWNLAVFSIVPVAVIVASWFQDLKVIVATLLLLQFVFLIVTYFYWIRRLIGRCAAAYASAILRPWLCGAVMALAVLWILDKMEDKNPFIQLLVAVPSGGLLYAVLNAAFNKSALMEIVALLPVDSFKRRKASES